MSKVSTLRNKIRSKIEVIKKINDNPKLTSDNLYDLYGEGVTKVDKLLSSKIDGLTSKFSKKNNENKQDIFGSLIDTASGFLNSKSNDIQVNDKLITGNKIKKYALQSADKTLKSGKQIVMDSVKEVLFVDSDTSICGVETLMPNDTMTISPKEIDFLEMLQNEPPSKIGQIMYEAQSPSVGEEKVNRELYNSFSTPYTFSNKQGQSMFDLTWNSPLQEWNVTGLQQGGGGNIPKVGQFINDYYDNMESPDLNYIIKTSMLMTLQGDGENPEVFDKAINDLNRLCNKLFKICNPPDEGSNLIQTTSQQFSENDLDVESYFDFNDVEGIDLDDEDARFRKVLRFVDCGNFEVPSSESNFEDFVILSQNGDLGNLVDNTLENAARNAMINSGSDPKLIDNINLELINLFILNVPKAIVSSYLGPKVFLPLVISWKQLSSFAGDVKDLLKQFYKLFYKIIKNVFWKFIEEFWQLIKRDLLAFVVSIVARILTNKYKRYVTILTSLISLIRRILALGIKSCTDLFNAIIDLINNALRIGGPSINVPGVLLGLSDLLPGFSSDRAFMNATERMAAAGLNTGPVYGESNEMVTMVKNIIDGHTAELDTNSYVKVGNKMMTIPTPVGPIVIPPGILNSAGKIL